MMAPKLPMDPMEPVRGRPGTPAMEETDPLALAVPGSGTSVSEKVGTLAASAETRVEVGEGREWLGIRGVAKRCDFSTQIAGFAFTTDPLALAVSGSGTSVSERVGTLAASAHNKT